MPEEATDESVPETITEDESSKTISEEPTDTPASREASPQSTQKLSPPEARNKGISAATFRKNGTAEITLSTVLDDIFLRYDKNEDGLLNAEELRPCIEEYTAHAITQAQCATFLKSIDLSGDGEIDKSEMTHFISEGILLSPAMKQQYAARGEFHKTIVEFFSGVEDHFTRLKNLYSQSMVVHDVQSLLDQIWKIYDAEGRGFLDAASIKKLLKDFTGHDVGQDKCNDFLRSVDENGDSVIEKHELQNFIENGIALEERDRNEYSERGGLHKTIVEFFDGVESRLSLATAVKMIQRFVVIPVCKIRTQV